MALNFKRKIEDFICGNCGQGVKGDDYTNASNADLKNETECRRKTILKKL